MAGLLTEVVLLSCLLLFGVLAQEAASRRRLFAIVCVALAVRALILVATTLALDNSVDAGFAFFDDEMYHDTGLRIASLWNSGYSADPEHLLPQGSKNPGYYYLNAGLYWIFGTDYFVGRVFNLFLSTFSILLVFQISTLGWSRAVGLRAAFAVAVLPDISMWSVWLFKDAVVGFLILQSVLGMQRAVLGYAKPASLITSFIAVALLYQFRIEAALLLAAAFGAALLTTQFARWRSRIVVALLALVIIAILSGSWMEFLASDNIIGAQFLAEGSFNELLNSGNVFTRLVRDSADPGDYSAGLISYGYIFGVQDLWRLPIALIFVVLVPFPPWPHGISLASDLVAVASVPWLIVMPIVLMAICSGWYFHPVRARVLLYFLTLQWVALALFMFGFNPSRHRISCVPLMLILAAAYWPKRGTASFALWMGAVLFLVLAAIAYSFL